MMQKSDRLRALSKALDSQAVIHLREAVSLLGVSEMTVRRDVAAHPDLFTYLGGHIVNAAKLPASGAYVLEAEQEHCAQAKAQACMSAARLIAAHDTVFVDCGSTLARIGHYIPHDLQVTVVCYSLNVAEAVRRMDNIRLIVLGGLYVPSSDSFTGSESLEALRHMGINKALISAGGIDMTRQLLEFPRSADQAGCHGLRRREPFGGRLQQVRPGSGGTLRSGRRFRLDYYRARAAVARRALAHGATVRNTTCPPQHAAGQTWQRDGHGVCATAQSPYGIQIFFTCTP